FLQETHSDSRNLPDWTQEWPGLSCLSHNTSTSGGVAILFSKNFTPVTYDTEELVKGRLLKVRAHFENHVFIFICVYAPTSPVERLNFLDVLCTAIEACDDEEFLFVGGDFNCTVDNSDRNHTEPHMPSRTRLTQILQTYGLCDTWRSFHGSQRQYT
ncbi:hypothetical protein HF521_011809, partial [Silurus meridionalis]